MDRWEILTEKFEGGPGLYQEKFIIICQREADFHKLQYMAKRRYPDAEPCEVPERILELYPLSFGYWVNKHDPKCSPIDLKNGSIRKKIT
jgi:hypothetical protein